jgi:ABC-2 type transport system ATP-binding protein
MILVRNLVKHYKVHSRPPGVRAALRSLVHRHYDVVKAVDGISFSIEAGERVGFLGPNGAGKTTTLKVLSGLLVPTDGEVRVLGHEPSRRAYDFLSSIMLVAGQKNQLLWDLPPADTFDLNRAIYGVSTEDFRERVDELVSLLEIGEVIRKPTRQLSLGERMKCELAAALLHRPAVLFLDEPTIGLDVTMQAVVRRFIRTYTERYGATLLLTSHNMDDVGALCERVIIIDHGRLLYDGSLAGLVRQTRPEKRVTLQLSRPVLASDLTSFGRIVEHAEGRVVLQVAQPALQDAVQGVLSRLPVSDLTVEEPPLEEVLADLFARARAEREAEAAGRGGEPKLREASR